MNSSTDKPQRRYRTTNWLKVRSDGLGGATLHAGDLAQGVGVGYLQHVTGAGN